MVGPNLIQQNVVQPGTQVRMMLQQGQTIRGNEIVGNQSPVVGQPQQQQQQQQIVHQTITNVGGNQTIMAGSPQIQKQQQPPPYPEPPPPYPGQSQVLFIKKILFPFLHSIL
jgi:hypothetical protein